MLAVFNLDLFQRVRLAMANQDVRYYLNAVRVERNPYGDGVVIIATNGHLMLLGFDPRGFCLEDGLLIKPVGTFGRVGGKFLTDEVRIVVRAFEPDPVGKLILAVEQGPLVHDVRFAEKVKARYPNWRDLVAKTDEALCAQHKADGRFGEPGFVSCSYLKKMASAFDNFGGGRYSAPIRLLASGTESAVILRPARDNEGRELMGLLMPMHMDKLLAPVPAWATRPVKAAA